MCLSRNPRLQRQLLYLELDVLEVQEQVLQRKPAVSLDAGAHLNIRDLGSTPSADLSWSLSLSVTAPELARADFSVDLDGHGLTQRSSFSWPDRSQHGEFAMLPSDDRNARRAVLHLQELLHRMAAAERSVARFAPAAVSSLKLFAVYGAPEAVSAGDLPLLSLAIDSVYSLLQAELEFDQTLLELAAECQLPVVYETYEAAENLLAETPLTATVRPVVAAAKSARW